MPPDKKHLKVDEEQKPGPRVKHPAEEVLQTPKVVEKDPSDVISPKPKLKEPYVVPMSDVAAKVKTPEGNSESDKVQAKLLEILKKYNMCESDIPVTGDSPDIEYWELRKQLQGMRNA